MKTFTLKAGDITRDWYVADAEGQVLGRFASKIATILRGKHKPTFSPHLDMGDFVVVTNANKIATTGGKATKKTYWHHTGWIGNQKEVSFEELLRRHPDRVIKSAVKGMLPHNRLGRKMLRHLKVYAGPAHPHEAQQPKSLEL